MIDIITKGDKVLCKKCGKPVKDYKVKTMIAHRCTRQKKNEKMYRIYRIVYPNMYTCYRIQSIL